MDITKSQIVQGDSLELIKQLPDESIDLLLTDPPYNVGRKNNLTTMGRKGIDWEWDGEFDQTKWIDLIYPKLKKGANIVIWNSWENLGDIKKHLEGLGASVKRELVYSKTNPFPRNIERSFVQSREYAIWGVKKGKWTFNKRPGKGYETGLFVYPVQHSNHPAKKPEGMFSEIIEILSNKGDLVVDPFCGLGTTNMAAEKLGRVHIGFELDINFFNEASAELNKLRGINGNQSTGGLSSPNSVHPQINSTPTDTTTPS